METNIKYKELMREFENAKSLTDDIKKAGALHQATLNLSKAYIDAIDAGKKGDISELVNLYGTYLGRLVLAFRKDEYRKNRYFLNIPQDVANKTVVKLLSFSYRDPERALVVLNCAEKNVIHANPETIEKFVSVYKKEGLNEKEGLLRKIFA